MKLKILMSLYFYLLARTIIDCYIPVILYNKGLEIRGFSFHIVKL